MTNSWHRHTFVVNLRYSYSHRILAFTYYFLLFHYHHCDCPNQKTTYTFLLDQVSKLTTRSSPGESRPCLTSFLILSQKQLPRLCLILRIWPQLWRAGQHPGVISRQQSRIPLSLTLTPAILAKWRSETVICSAGICAMIGSESYY